ncbi:MAG: response regulator transcription factor [Nitrospira sp.]|nr:response regulator transcription factor [Nitrospira sp.]
MLCADHKPGRCRVLLADEQVIVAAGIRALIERYCDVVGIVEDGRSLLAEAERVRPDVIVMEVLLPLLNGLDAARQLARIVPASRLVFLTVQESTRQVADAFKLGAAAYLLKRSPAPELRQAIEAVQRGAYFLTSLLTKSVMATNQSVQSGAAQAPVSVSSLTPRQREVLQLIAEGRGTKEVARLLNIAVKTVEFHKFRIMDQLNLHSTVALTKCAIAEGLARL